MRDNKDFPIQGGTNWNCKGARPVVRYPGCTIPYWLAEEAYRVYAAKFGTDQSLERLSERGGFGRQELVWLLAENKERAGKL